MGLSKVFLRHIAPDSLSALGRIKTPLRVRISRQGTLNGVMLSPPEACVFSSYMCVYFYCLRYQVVLRLKIWLRFSLFWPVIKILLVDRMTLNKRTHAHNQRKNNLMHGTRLMVTRARADFYAKWNRGSCHPTIELAKYIHYTTRYTHMRAQKHHTRGITVCETCYHTKHVTIVTVAAHTVCASSQTCTSMHTWCYLQVS